MKDYMHGYDAGHRDGREHGYQELQDKIRQAFVNADSPDDLIDRIKSLVGVL